MRRIDFHDRKISLKTGQEKKKKTELARFPPFYLVCRNLEKVMLLPNKAKVGTTKS